MDTAKNRILPFDIPFSVVLHNDKDDPIKFLYFFKINHNGDVVPDKQTSAVKKWREKAPTISPLIRVTSRKDSLAVDLPGLKPDKRYALVAVTEKDKLSVLRSIARDYCDGQTIKPFEVEIYPPDYFGRSNKAGSRQLVPARFIVQQLEAADANCDLCVKLNKKPTPLITPNFIDKEFKDPPFGIPFCDTCKVAKDSTASGQIDWPRELAFLDGVIVLLEKWGPELVKGTYRIDTLSRRKVNINLSSPSKGDAERLQNLVQTAVILNAIRQSIYLLTSEIGSATRGYVQNLDRYIDLIQANIEILRSNIGDVNSLNSCLSGLDIPAGWNMSSLINSTSSYQFLTRNSYFIKPDFGLFYYGNKLFSNNAQFAGVGPFVGFHVNFRGTNPDVPFNRIPGFWKYPTIQVGVPLLADDIANDVSRKHLVGNRFSIFTGIGFNIAHSARITFGSLLFRRLDGSPSGEANYKLASAPYISIGIDIRLRAYFKGLYDAIQTLSGAPL